MSFKKNSVIYPFFSLLLFTLCVVYTTTCCRNDIIYFLKIPINFIFNKFYYLENIWIERKDLIQKINNLSVENEALRQNSTSLPKQHCRVYHYLDNGFNRHLIIEKLTTRTCKNFQILTTDGHVLGHIIEYGHYTCRARLITDIQAKVPVVIPSTGQNAILKGHTQTTVKLEKLFPADSVPQIGETVYTSGICGIYFKNLPIARIIEISDKGIIAEPLFDISRINIVNVVRND